MNLLWDKNMCWPPKNVTFFQSKLLLDNSASFTSWRMKDLCQKRDVKLFFFEGPTGYQEPGLLSVWKSLTSGVIWNSLMAWPDWLWSPPPLFYDKLRHWLHMPGLHAVFRAATPTVDKGREQVQKIAESWIYFLKEVLPLWHCCATAIGRQRTLRRCK